jgi:hypothetical protein
MGRTLRTHYSWPLVEKNAFRQDPILRCGVGIRVIGYKRRPRPWKRYCITR